MANHIHLLLRQWHKARSQEWVLAVVTSTAGSSYRKQGAMMFVDSMGQTIGLVSGGCLENDVMRQARGVMQSGQAKSIVYDMREEESLAWQLGIGCGGRIELSLLPVNEDNGYLGFEQVLEQLESGQSCYWHLDLDTYQAHISEKPSTNDSLLQVLISSQTKLLVFGAGVDAMPMVKIAQNLGWHCTLIESRTSHANRARQIQPEQLVLSQFDRLKGNEAWLQKADVAIVMQHSVHLDSQALRLLCASRVRYLGLLGPEHRKQKVLDHERLTAADLPCPVAGPMGLNLGGELPESIALAVMAEILAVLNQSSAKSLSEVVCQS